MSLGNNEKKMLRCMRSKQENIWTLEELLEITQWNDQVHVAGAGKSLDENEFVETIEKRQGYKIACLEEIAWRNGWLTEEQIMEASKLLSKSSYGKYLMGLLS